MKHLGIFFSVLLSFVLALSACNDKRKPVTKVPVRINKLPPQNLISIGEVQYDGQATTVLQMVTKGTSIFLTGRPFGFARWDIGANPEKPQLTFAAATQIDRFFGKWVVDWWTSGALALMGPYAITSGTVGASMVSLAETHRPKEIRRYPQYKPDEDEVTADDAYIWSALVPNPSKPILYAFRQQDYLFTLRLNGSSLQVLSKDAYGETGENVCCVNGATVFENRVFVAFRSKLMFFDIAEDGRLVNPSEFGNLQAVNVASSPNLLYVQHEPGFGDGSGKNYPKGIYVFDKQGRNIAFLEQSPLIFTVSSNDSHLYANLDDNSVRIFRLVWR